MTSLLSSWKTGLPHRIAAFISVFGASVLLSACVLSPGMHMGPPSEAQETIQEDAAPPGALTSITHALIEQQKAARATEVKAEISSLFGTPEPYKIGPGDILNIVVWDHPELALQPISSSRSMGSTTQADIGNGYNVNPNGQIQFPYAGVVRVAGLSELQVRNVLTDRIAAYINNPQLTVRIQSYRNRRVYIDGEVRTPGLQVMDDLPMTLPEALNRAGGFTPAADRSSIILTRGDTSTRINLTELSRLGVNPSRIMLENGDMLRVVGRDESKVFVLGEIIDPRSQELRDGYLTLGEALGEAGGPNPVTSQPSQIYVIRKNADGGPDIYHLDAKSPVAYVLASQFELEPQDVVFVDAAPVVRWNRVISMLLPSYGVITTTRNITR